MHRVESPVEWVPGGREIVDDFAGRRYGMRSSQPNLEAGAAPRCMAPRIPAGEPARLQLTGRTSTAWAYVDGFIEWYKRDKAGLSATYPGMSGCQDKDQLRIASDIVYYDFCSSRVTTDFGDSLTDLLPDVPENAE